MSFPQRRTNTDAARVRRGLHENPPLLILGSWSKADPSLSSPSWSSFSIFSYFLAKVNLSNHRNHMCAPLEDIFRWDSHTDVTTWFLHDFLLLFDRPVLLCGDPLPELASNIPPAHKKTPGKRRPWLTSAWCLTSPSWALISASTCLLMCVFIMSRCRCTNCRPRHLRICVRLHTKSGKERKLQGVHFHRHV